MVSGRLILPQSTPQADHARPLIPKRGASQILNNLVGGTGFAAYIAPEKQNLRSRAQGDTPRPEGNSAPASRPAESQGDRQASLASIASEMHERLGTGEQFRPDHTDTQRSGGDSGRETDSETIKDAADNAESQANWSDSRGIEAPTREHDQSSMRNAESIAEDTAASPIENADSDEVEPGVAAVQGHAELRQGAVAAPEAEADQSGEAAARSQRKHAETPQQQAHASISTRSSGEQPSTEQAGARHSNIEAGIRGDDSDDSRAGAGGEERRDRSESRALQGNTVAGEEATQKVARDTTDKPSFIDSLREDRVDQRTEAVRSSETAHARSGQSGNEPFPLPKLDPSISADRPSGQPHGERSAISARPEQEAAVSQSVKRGMSAVLRQGGGSLTMKLSPATLGDIRIEMTMQSGRVAVQFDVGSLAAYEAIKGQIGELRHSLEQRGMTVERVEAHISPALARSSQSDGNANQRSGDQSAHSGESQDKHDASEGESRGRASSEDRADARKRFSDGSGPVFGDAANFEHALNIGLDAVA